VCAIADRQQLSEAQVELLAAKVADLAAQLEPARENGNGNVMFDDVKKVLQNVSCLEKKLDDSMADISARFDQTNGSLSLFANCVDQARGPPVTNRGESDCQMNIILSGIKENKNPEVWRKKVDKVISYVAGRSVEIMDMLRVRGPFINGKTRPVLVKLKTVWDKRVLLNSKRKLKDYTGGRVYLQPDEPLGVRRKATMERLA